MVTSSTLDALKRWSCSGNDHKSLPAVSQIKAVHIYDFDNTLFLSPLPNPRLWTQYTVGFLKSEDTFANGGWFHDNRLLEATGKGMQKEELRAWHGWWNEDVVKLVELSIRQEDALTVLLTGRGEKKFANVINRMIKAKRLDFDLVCLKPSSSGNGRPFQSTMNFKQTLIRDLVANCQEVAEIKIYEDRPKHAEKFREFLNNINLDLLRGEFSSGRRKQLAGEVIQVSQKTVPLDPLTECTEVQNMINLHNATNPFPRLQIKRTIFFTGYLLNKSDADNLITLLDDSILKAPDVKILAHNIMITTKPATEAVLDKVGGLGAKQIWQVTAIGNWNGSIYGAKVNPIPSSAVVSVESSTPVVVLATLRGAKSVDSQRITNWQALPTDKHFVFETTVGENVQLRIEPEQEGESEYDSLLPKMHAPHTFAQKRKVAQNENERSGRGDDRRVNGGFRGGRGARDRDRGERRLRDRDSGMRSGGRATTIREHRNDRIQRKQQQRNNNYRSLDDISNGSAVATQYRNEAYSAGNSVYVDHSSDLRQPHDAGDRYTSAGGPAKHSGGYDGNDDGGLHY